MKKIRFGKLLLEGQDFVATRVDEMDDLLIVCCADAYQMLKLEIPKAILESCSQNKIKPKFRDRLTLYKTSLNDAGFDDNCENMHFYASFLLSADINGKKWLRLPEHKAFAVPFNTGII